MKFGALVASLLLVLGSRGMAATVYVDAVVPGLTATDHSADSEVFARGYYSIGDGGGGWFSQSSLTSCSSSPAASYTTGSDIAITGGTAGILVGMGVSGTNITGGDYIVAVTPTTITLKVAPGGSGTSVTISGGNGGTLIGDYAHTGYAGHCFNRAGTTNWSVREWGARCDVTPIFDTGSFDPAHPTIFHSGSAPALSSADAGKKIVIPGLGTGPYYPVRTVVSSAGTGYMVGDILTLDLDGGTGTAATIMLDAWSTTASAVVFHFVSYGSYTVPPSGTITVTGGHGMNLTLTSNWGGSTFVSTIQSVSGGAITLADSVPFPITANPKEWYYGDDDGTAINSAIANVSAAGATQLNIPGNCGTTVPINASTAAISNPALVGLSQSASGLYALGAISGNVFNRSDVNNSNAGGGLSNMTIEAMGLTSGPAVEVDGGKFQLYSNLEVRNAIGNSISAPNAVFRCGSDSDSNADAGDNMYQNIRAHTDQALFSEAQFPSYDFDAAGQCHDNRFYADTAVNATVANFMHFNGGGLHIDHLHTFNSISPNAAGSAMYGVVSAQHDYIVGTQIDDAAFAGLFLAPNGNQAATSQRVVETWVDCGSLKGIGVPGAFTLNTTGSLTNNVTTFSLTSTTGIAVGMALSGIGIPVGSTITNLTPLTMSIPATDTRSGNITVTGGYRGVEISDGDYGATVTATADQSQPTNACSIADSAMIQQDGVASPSTAVFANGHASYSTIPSVYSGVLNQIPQGRLTLTSGHPVMTADVTGAAIIYYAPYSGTFVPIFNGVNVGMYQFTSSATDTVGLSLPLSASNHTGGHLYDLFVFEIGGVAILGSGPQWTNTTTRSVVPQFYQGLWTNPSAMTVSYGSPLVIYSCPQNQCTYVGTVYITSNGQTCMQFQPAAAAGGVSTCGTGAFAGLWNAYNRVRAYVRIKDSNAAWNAVTAAAWEAADYSNGGANNNLKNRINYVDGLQVSQARASVDQNNQSTSGVTPAPKPSIGVSFDWVTPNAPDVICKQQATQVISMSCEAFSLPLLGLHYAQAVEQAAGTTGTPFGTSLTTALDWEY